MATISSNAKLSKRYTNHKIKGTTATTMKAAGHRLEEIALITKNKNLVSLKLYLAKPTIQDKENCPNSLCMYGGANSAMEKQSRCPKTPPEPNMLSQLSMMTSTPPS